MKSSRDLPAAVVGDRPVPRSDEVPGDAKTIDDRVAFYQPQMDAYRRAAAALASLDPAQVTVQLAFTNPGVVREV